MTENRMIIDSDWEWNESTAIKEKLNGAGYTEISSKIFVPEEDAYGYALERISQDEGLKQEFVEWFYSGNWVFENGKEIHT